MRDIYIYILRLISIAILDQASLYEKTLYQGGFAPGVSDEVLSARQMAKDLVGIDPGKCHSSTEQATFARIF